jgi:hypothetical protein
VFISAPPSRDRLSRVEKFFVEQLERGPRHRVVVEPQCAGAGAKASAAYQELHSSPLFQRIGVQRFALLGDDYNNVLPGKIARVFH